MGTEMLTQLRRIRGILQMTYLLRTFFVSLDVHS
jgi:hypothetical protein